jgi:hypothetical protein
VSLTPPYRRPTYEVARHGARADRTDAARDQPVPADLRRSANWVRAVAAAVAVVALTVTALLGGFDQVGRAETSDLPVIAVDEEFNGGLWLITVESAQVGRNLRDFRPATEGDLVLQVNVRIVKTDNCTCGVLDVIDLRDVPGLSENDVTTRSLRDNSLALDLQVGLPIRVAFLWPIAQGTPIPPEITVVINGSTRRLQNFRFLGTTIEIDEPKATVIVPVADQTGIT